MQQAKGVRVTGGAFLPLPVDDPRQRQPDIGCALRDLNWKPRIALRDGLVTTIAYFDDLVSSGYAWSAAAE